MISSRRAFCGSARSSSSNDASSVSTMAPEVHRLRGLFFDPATFHVRLKPDTTTETWRAWYNPRDVARTSNRTVRWTAAALLIAVVVAAAWWWRRPVASSHPNLILITIDTLRADHVGAYGAKSGATPTLDA